MDLEKKRLSLSQKKLGRPIVMEEPWNSLAKAMGGTIELANYLGVSKSTLNKWVNKVHRIPTTTLKELERLSNQHGVAFKIDP